MYARILTATDSPDACDPAVMTAARIAMRDHAKLYILHCLESPYSGKYRQVVKHFETAEEIVSDREYEKAVAQHLSKTCNDALKPFDEFEVKVTGGFPWQEIHRWARSTRADLIVLGPHSTRAEAKGVARVSGTIGSTVEGVILHAHCPVLVVRTPTPEPTVRFQRIMVAIDFSKSCEYALQFAEKMATKHDGTLHLFHVVPVPVSRKYPQPELEQQISDGKEQLRAFARDVSKDIPSEFTVWEGGSPHVEILKYAREKGIELITMGSHTWDKGERWYVGSAVEQVSSRAMCPVAIISDPKAVLKLKD